MIRVAIAAGYPALRAGLRALLEGFVDINVVGELPPGGDSESDMPAFDVLLIDLEAPSPPGLAAFPFSLSDTPALALVPDPAAGVQALTRSAPPRGVLLREADGEQVAAALRAVTEGLVVLDPAISAALAAGPVRDLSTVAPGAPTLSPRELEVVRLIALGLPNKGIASRLGISEHTVKFHVGTILGKLGAESRTEAVIVAARNGWLPL